MLDYEPIYPKMKRQPDANTKATHYKSHKYLFSAGKIYYSDVDFKAGVAAPNLLDAMPLPKNPAFWNDVECV